MDDWDPNEFDRVHAANQRRHRNQKRIARWNGAMLSLLFLGISVVVPLEYAAADHLPLWQMILIELACLAALYASFKWFLWSFKDDYMDSQ